MDFYRLKHEFRLLKRLPGHPYRVILFDKRVLVLKMHFYGNTELYFFHLKPLEGLSRGRKRYVFSGTQLCCLLAVSSPERSNRNALFYLEVKTAFYGNDNKYKFCHIFEHLERFEIS